jgi:hypothetical protein
MGMIDVDSYSAKSASNAELSVAAIDDLTVGWEKNKYSRILCVCVSHGGQNVNLILSYTEINQNIPLTVYPGAIFNSFAINFFTEIIGIFSF